MRTTIDRAGRVVVPKGIRDRLHLTGGAEVEITEADGIIEVAVVGASIEIVETPEGPVARAVDGPSPLTDADVRAAIDAGRR